MAKPELLTIPQVLLADTRETYEEFVDLDDNLVLEIQAEFYLNNLLEFDEFPNPESAYEDLRDYMICMFEIYRRHAEMTSDNVTRELVGEILLHFWPIFQATQEETAQAMIDFCDSQLDVADEAASRKWLSIQQSLQSFVSP